MAMTVAEIRARYRNESSDWIRDRIADLRVTQARAEAVRDSTSAAIIGSCIDELTAAVSRPAEPTPEERVEAADAWTGAEPVETEPVQEEAEADGLVLADLSDADIRQLNRVPLQKLAKAHGINGRQTNKVLVRELIELKKAQVNA